MGIHFLSGSRWVKDTKQMATLLSSLYDALRAQEEMASRSISSFTRSPYIGNPGEKFHSLSSFYWLGEHPNVKTVLYDWDCLIQSDHLEYNSPIILRQSLKTITTYRQENRQYRKYPQTTNWKNCGHIFYSSCCLQLFIVMRVD